MSSFKKFIYNLTAAHDFRKAVHQLKDMEEKLHAPWARYAIPFIYKGSGHFRKIRPRQNPFEIESLFDAVLKHAPKYVLEVGTARGGTLYLWTQAAKEDALIVSVDLPDGMFGGGYPPCRIPFYQSFKKPNQTLHLIRDDSHAQHTFDATKAHFGDNPVDFAFIDADHTYEGVKADFEMYGQLVRPGGLIAFHDILVNEEDPHCQVHRFWNEIKDQYDSQEFIGTGRKIGIGLIRLPE